MKSKKFFLFLLLIFILTTINAYAGSKVCRLEFKYKFNIRGNPQRVRFLTVIPQNKSRCQKILDIKFSPKPKRIFKRMGTRYAEFIFINPKSDFDVKINVRILLYRFDLFTAKEYSSKPDSNEDAGIYLVQEKYIEKNSPFIQNAINVINDEDEVVIVKRIYETVKKRMKYGGFDPGQKGANKAFLTGKGDCTEYSDLMVAMCRAKDIPARVVDGYITNYGNDTPKHNWVEVYFKNFGWVPFDPLLGDLKKASFYKLSNMYIYLSTIRNDSTILNGHFYAYWWRGGSVEVKEDFRVR